MTSCPFFKFETLANATGDFSEVNKLGKGGFGSVYKVDSSACSSYFFFGKYNIMIVLQLQGELTNGGIIAVKRLSQASTQGMQEFLNKLVLISKLQHRNLVRLIGCCIEHKEKMLIYEYMSNKSLDFFLFG